MKKTFLLIIDLIFLTRPIIIVPVWAFCVFGALFSFPKAFSLEPSHYLLIFLYSMSAASVYVINQMADYEVDKTNEGFPLLVRGNISMKAAGVCAGICGLISILGPFLMGYASVALLSLIAIIAGYLYSCKPFSLSGRPFSDFLTNAFEAFLAFAAGWCIYGEQLTDPALYKQALPFFLLMCAGSISSTLPDILGDKAHGKITTAVRFGPKSAHCIALMALIAVIPASLLISQDAFAAVCSILVIPAYIPYLFNSKSIFMEIPHKVGGAIVMLIAATVDLMLLPAGIIIYFMTWLYFRLRHRVAYPSLKPRAMNVQ